ncbi:hypothetical protein [Lutibacter sp.]|uniref:hypothetical protein n=1 Tax=Lutibacter sp. TaxID=1925666 RepID=UPI0027354284|nr:hypothetical protein [Lutibacter sp.]MDP3313552.1 hypothetical protein [Lutibacter sp.]
MASIKNLKKDINYVLGDIIEECYTWELMNSKADSSSTEAIVNEAIESFDKLVEKVNVKKVADKRAHFNAINKELEETASNLIKKINKL